MESLIQDLRYGIRMLLNRPGFTVVAVIALALGIGANTAIFSVINAVLLRPLPYPEADRLVWIWENNPTSNVEKEPISLPNYMDYRAQCEGCEEVGAFSPWSPALTGLGEPEKLNGAMVSASLFPVLRTEPARGRAFMPEEDAPGKNRVVVLSHGLWQRRFGGDTGILGQAITLNGTPFTVVGVMPEGFQFPSPKDRVPAELWIPIGGDPTRMVRRMDFLNVVARLKPSVTLEQARAELATIAGRLAEQYPDANAGWTTTVISLHDRFSGDVRPAMILLLGAVILLLFIACANVANLLLVRATARHKEIAIRKALGAGRGRLVRQMLTESVVLALIGGALGSLLALWGIKILIAFSPGNIPRIGETRLDARVLGFTLAISLLTGILFGLMPALQASNPDLNETLKEGGKGNSGTSSGRRLRNMLVVFEIAVVLVLLVSAGLMIKSFVRLQQVNPGFNPEKLLTMTFNLPRNKYREEHQVASFYNQLVERLGGMSGIEDVGLISNLPLSGEVSVLQILVEGRPEPPPGHVIGAQSQIVNPAYFRAMSIPLLKGRLFSEQDTKQTPGVIVINDVMAERYWPGEDPLGKRITMGSLDKGPWLTVIGVVSDVRQVGLNADPYPQMYESFLQNSRWGSALVVRTSGDPKALIPSIRGQLASIDKDQPLSNVRTMDEVFSESISRPRFNVLLISIFTVIALALAAVGIYAVISYSVMQRTHEIGLRMALGAQQGDILRLVVKQGMTLAAVGISIGLVMALILAFTLTRFMSSLLYQVNSTDPLTFASVPVGILGLALIACYIPARRATRVDPINALRYE